MAGRPTGPTRVLIVDDERSVLEFLDRVLRGAGYTTTIASSGRDAVDVASASDPFDLLLTDVMMPEMRGDELAAQLRITQPDVKVLYLTGYADRLFAEKITLWEGEAFLEKPASVQGVLEAVSLVLFGRLPPPAAPTA